MVVQKIMQDGRMTYEDPKQTVLASLSLYHIQNLPWNMVIVTIQLLPYFNVNIRTFPTFRPCLKIFHPQQDIIMKNCCFFFSNAMENQNNHLHGPAMPTTDLYLKRSFFFNNTCVRVVFPT